MTDGCTWGDRRCTKKIGGGQVCWHSKKNACWHHVAPFEALPKRMLPVVDLQDAGGGEAAAACICKECLPCMKCTVVFYLVRVAKSASPSSLIFCDRYVQRCTKQSPG